MREIPILFSGPMVRAILAGTKTQTRRIVSERAAERMGLALFGATERLFPGLPREPIVVPPGVARWALGDRLWVRERFALSLRDPSDVENARPREKHWWDDVVYAADNSRVSWSRHTLDDNCNITRSEPIAPPWRPSIHMPRWASRVTLEVAGVRVERLQWITESDAKAEGATQFPADPEGNCWTPGTYRTAYNYLWNEINGPDAWNANPWVWVIEFRRADQEPKEVSRGR